LVDRWYQRLSDSGSYLTWMTLTGHRQYEAGMATLWSGPFSAALSGYNDDAQIGGTHTIHFGDSPPASWHDVHMWASDDGCVTVTMSLPGGGSSTPPPICVGAGATGRVAYFDEGFHACPSADCDSQHSRPNTWWFAIVIVNNAEHTGPRNDAWSRQATASHELGHAAGLAHDNSPGSPGVQDYDCGNLQPMTVMDYDCYFSPEVTNVGQRWDACGINHAYYDPSWRYSGC
jgi:hypothetical protein